MHNGKPRRKILSVDMTAMCDVAFIILIFFVVSAKAKAWLPISIEEPAARNRIYDSEDNNAIILVSTDKVMFEIPKEIRKQTLITMGSRYHIEFTSEELSKFEKIETIGVPISQLKEFIDSDYNNWNNFFFKQPGIPVNPGNYELANWIDIASKAEKVTKDHDLDFMLDADKRNLYPQIERITDILTSQRIFKFSLVYITKSKV
ncbi:biopolymer transporter ExbD [Mucilaginibacter sp. X4EP1]|uniref:biopolymer transporter ExbD n=1 Tax=Mucilaginibacter sp. X4EP1 TaxID=2723092 RepID=UPI0021691D8C|nr:biopolymer transporter ExbD [Mucilaginibacter sp. X4EP1]MCS3814099.1 biopolymer transport protein ExbD [Mucilaginibacter sp. X4EP1]